MKAQYTIPIDYKNEFLLIIIIKLSKLCENIVSKVEIRVKFIKNDNEFSFSMIFINFNDTSVLSVFDHFYVHWGLGSCDLNIGATNMNIIVYIE